MDQQGKREKGGKYENNSLQYLSGISIDIFWSFPENSTSNSNTATEPAVNGYTSVASAGHLHNIDELGESLSVGSGFQGNF